MVPITYKYAQIIPGCVSLINKWRAENPTISTGTFEITVDRTVKWLYNLVLNREDRLIFMIRDLNNKFIGHLGFSSFNYNKKNAEVDSVLRGEKDVIPGIMTFAMRALMRFGINELQLNKIILHVYADNTHAVNFYNKNGFVVTKQIPLYKVKIDDEIKLEIAPDDYTGKISRYYSLMTLDEESYKTYQNKN
jgi:RimJ/RimL family protein N-acetyltransferase